MPLTGLKLYGSTVKNFRTALGWGSQKSSVTVSLVQDTTLGDYFLPPPIGALTYITFGSLNFWGILQKWEKVSSADGLPTFEVFVEDPRSILEGTEVVLNNYNASTYGTPNLLNVYGYLENLYGFGGSEVNETGMFWTLLSQGIYDLTNGVAGTWGGPLSYKGYYYNVDLSGIPNPPSFYRLGGSTNMTLMEIIDRICNDSGLDYFIDLIPNTTTIRVRTVSRKLQPPSGYIQELVDSSTASGTCIKSQVGLEAVNQVTSAFIVGGPVHTMYDAEAAAMHPYFGKDINNNPIIGNLGPLFSFYEIYSVGGTQLIRNTNGHWVSNDGNSILEFDSLSERWALNLKSTGNVYVSDSWDGTASKVFNNVVGAVGDTQTVTAVGATIIDYYNIFDYNAQLNSSEIYDLIGTYGYSCTVREMCFALQGYNDWADFIGVVKPALANLLGIVPPGIPPVNNGAAIPIMPQDFLNLTPAAILLMAKADASEIKQWAAQRVYNFVRNIANEFLGKKFLVELPFVFVATDEDTGIVKTSYDIVNAGYVDTGIPPLGLNPVYTNNFTTQDGLFNSYSLYTNTAAIDLSKVSSTEFLIDVYNGNGIYVSSRVDPEIIFLDELTPVALVSISSPLFRQPIDSVGGINIIAALLQVEPQDANKIFRKFGAGNFWSTIHAPPVYPDFITIPLKSNILSYGPWYGIGAQGKVYFQQNTSLTPWGYGDIDLMNLAANAQVTEAITGQQSAESGTIELVGAPIFNIGDQLALTGEVLKGPTITSIDVGYSGSGVTSTYTLRTFTPKFGAFSKDNVERLKKISLRNQELRRESLDAINRLLVPREVTNELVAAIGLGLNQGTPPQLLRQSPHSVFSAIMDADATDATLSRVSATTLSDKEIIMGIPSSDLDSDLYDRSAMMSITGLIRPISTSYTSNILAQYEQPNTNYHANSVATFLDPFKSGNDIELYTYDTTTHDSHAYLNNGPITGGVRGFGLRGPLVISGWGWCTDDAFVPNQNPTTLDGPELTNYLRKSDFWKTGPVDLLWDDERMVWTPHDVMMGVTVGSCAGNGGSTTIKLYDDVGQVGGRKKDRTVYNFFSTTVDPNKKVFAAWIPDAQKWYIIAVDCV